MIAKPCPSCGRPDAGCGCDPFYETECRNCGSTVLGRSAPNACHRCTSGTPASAFSWFEPTRL